MNIKHSVICVTYNQEDYIEKALMSLLNERVQPYEIIVSDDCSSDSTVQIVKRIQKEYPDIVKLNLNQRNLGVFGNFNVAMPLPVGDMIHFVSGDDWVRPGMLEYMNEVISCNSLNPALSSFVIAPDVVIHDPDGSEYIQRNRHIRHSTPFKMLLREQFSTRMVGFSRGLYNNVSDYDETIGLWADRLHELKLLSHVSKVYHVSKPFPVYRAKVGISSKEKAELLSSSYIKVLNLILTDLHENLDKDDIKFIDYLYAREFSRLDAKIGKTLRFYWQALLNFNNGAKLSDILLISKALIKSFL